MKRSASLVIGLALSIGIVLLAGVFAGDSRIGFASAENTRTGPADVDAATGECISEYSASINFANPLGAVSGREAARRIYPGEADTFAERPVENGRVALELSDRGRRVLAIDVLKAPDGSWVVLGAKKINGRPPCSPPELDPSNGVETATAER
jgi:hypothetical protein